MNENGIKLLKEFEGRRLAAYKDPVGIWTIGYGHTSAAGGPIVRKGLTITAQDAEAILMRDLGQYEDAVDRLVKVFLSENQKAALSSFTYNVGVGAFTKSSVLRELNKGNYDAVPAKLALWNKGRVNGKLVILKGLVRRRAAEGELFLTPDIPIKFKEPVTTKAEIEPGKKPAQSTTIFSALMTALTSLVPLLVGMDWKIAVPLIVVSSGFAFWIIRERLAKSRMDGV